MPLASSHCATATAAHKTPCQNRGTKSSSKAARAHSQNTTQFALDNASSNRPHHANGRGNVGAEQIIEAAAPIASAAPSNAAVLSRRSRSARAAISRHNATTAPRNPRSIDIKPLVPTIGNTPNAIVEPRRLAHTPWAQLMSSRQIISKRLRTERSPDPAQKLMSESQLAMATSGFGPSATLETSAFSPREELSGHETA